MNRLFAVSLLILLSARFDDEPVVLDSLIRNAEKFNQSYPTEHVFIQTDRSYYKPGDELWFKAYVQNSLLNSELSNDLNIKLIDVFGKQILYLRYPLYDNFSNGYLILPAYLEEGKYYLIGYTGWMKNIPVSEAFTREIIVSSHVGRDMEISVNFDKELYYPGSHVEGTLKVHKKSDTKVNHMKYTFQCKSFRDNIVSGWGRIDEESTGHFNCQLPASLESDFLWIEFRIRYKRTSEVFVMPFPIASKSVNLDFYPEGGNIISGLDNLIAFKATNEYGKPVNIEGYLIDQYGRQMQKIKSTCKGLGKFVINPEADIKYKIQLVKPYLEKNVYKLPVAQYEGVQLHYQGMENGCLLFSVINNLPVYQSGIYMLIEQKARILWTASVDFGREKLIKVPAEKFKSGPVKCTLLDKQGNLLAARNVFINNSSGGDAIKFSATKTHYAKRERVILEYTNKNDCIIKSNISVFNNRFDPDPNISMENYFYFITELKELNPELVNADLSPLMIDLILLTHDLKSLPIRGLINRDKADPMRFYNNDGIIGQVVDKKGKPVENARVKIIHSLDLNTYQASSDLQGIFHITFDNNIINYNYLNAAVADENGKSGNTLKIFDHYSDNIVESQLVDKKEWEIKQILDQLKYGNPQLLFSGRYGQGKPDKKKRHFRKGYDYRKYSTYPSVLNIIREIKDFNIVNGEIIFSDRSRSGDNIRGAIIVLDGIVKGSNIEYLDQISPGEIRNISVLTWPNDIQRYTSLKSAGVIEILTIHGSNQDNIPRLADTQQDVLKIDHCFNGPDYSAGDNPLTDHRITLFWKPDLNMSKSGSGMVTFYTSDISGDYTCVLQGMDQNGNIFLKKVNITVK